MTEWALKALGSTAWWPSGLLPGISSWPGSPHLTFVGDVASVRSVASPLNAPLPLVTPVSVDASSGSIRAARVADDDGLVLGEDLEVDDVLVPSHGLSPCVLVSEEARGLAFRGFLVVRARRDLVDPVWIWVALTSASGGRARTAKVGGFLTPSLSASSLAGLSIPLPEHGKGGQLKSLLPRPLVVEEEEAALRSSWDFRDLRNEPKWVGGTVPGHAEGTPLSELGSVWSGAVDKASWFAAAAPERSPVLTPWAVRGHAEPFRPWATAGRATTDATVVFTRTAPFRVMHAPPRMLLSKDLLGFDVEDRKEPRKGVTLDDSVSASRTARALTTYFASRVGREALSSAGRGAIIQHLSLATMRTLVVPPHGLRQIHESPAAGALADRLEVALHEALLA
jgi:hypothetical protein